MNRIEDDLKAALRHKPAPDGFAAKVLQRIENEALGKRAPRRLFSNPFWRAAAAAGILMAAGAGIIGYRQQYIRVRNEAALNRTLAALSIAAGRLDEAEQKIFEPKRWEHIGGTLTEIQSAERK
jgi:hypothetical protein